VCVCVSFQDDDDDDDVARIFHNIISYDRFFSSSFLLSCLLQPRDMKKGKAERQLGANKRDEKSRTDGNSFSFL